MKKDKKIIVSVIAAGVIIFIISKFLKKGNGTQTLNFPKVPAFEDPKFIFKNARIDQSKIMQFPNYTWNEIITIIHDNPKDYKTIVEIFLSCKRQVQAAWLSRQFQIKYDKDLYKYLQNNIPKRILINIANYINNIPEVFTAAKPGEYGNQGYIKPLK